MPDQPLLDVVRMRRLKRRRARHEFRFAELARPALAGYARHHRMLKCHYVAPFLPCRSNVAPRSIANDSRPFHRSSEGDANHSSGPDRYIHNVQG